MDVPAARWLTQPLVRSRRAGPLRRTVETFVIQDDGRRFTVHGALEGEGHVEDDALRASYSVRWSGVRLTQHTERDGDRVTVHQQGPGFRGMQRLERMGGQGAEAPRRGT